METRPRHGVAFFIYTPSLSESYFGHIRNLRKIRSSIDLLIDTTIAVALIHSKLDFCNSLFLNLLKAHLDKLQSLLNYAARVITFPAKNARNNHILKSLH